MNYTLIRQGTSIFQSNRALLLNNTGKFQQFLTNHLKNYHFTTVNFAPRFIRDQKNEEFPIVTLTEENVQKNDKTLLNKQPSRNEDAEWDAVEAEMFGVKKPKGVKIPHVNFKGNRAFLKKGKAMFDMNKIDKKSNIYETKEAKPKKKAIKKVSHAEEIYDEHIGKYLKLERDDPLLDKLMLKIQSKKIQEGDQNITVEGRHLIQEGLKAGLTLELLVFSKIEQLKPIQDEIIKSKAKLYRVANHNLKLWSQLTTPGVLGVFKRPQNLNDLIEKRRNKDQIIPISIVLDNIREPNNMGSIIRVAAAAGADQVILTKGCTNPWDQKCLRGSSGIHFHVKIVGPIEWADISNHLPPKFEYYIADNQKSTEQSLPIVDYDALEFRKTGHEHKVLVIGGESHGVSDEAKHILHEITRIEVGDGAIVRIPLAEKVDSLNVASALSVLLFEMRRKLKKID